ncbi:hypothetical protein [Carnobacterium pleistocenium]|nr:hypothetical protein [Carnobacterium pleistocenium]
MKKRLKKKLSNNNKYELNELEELIFLAHRINKPKQVVSLFMTVHM